MHPGSERRRAGQRMVAIGVVQLAAGARRQRGSRRRTAVQVQEALAAGADLIVLPELAVPGYTHDRAVLEDAAETIDGPTVTEWRDALRGTDRVIVGGFCERVGDLLYNSVAVLGAGGLLGHYRKLHLFGEERRLFEPGNLGLPVVDTPVGRIGICVCYDLRFVEVVRALALRGAQIIAVPTAWVPGYDAVPLGIDGWAPQAHSARVLANLNQVAIACASVGGTDEGIQFLGSSLVIGPRGELHAGPLGPDGPGLAMATLDLDDIDAAGCREIAQPRQDRRDDVYRLIVDGELL